ncbi:MAG: tetratricopeptide repeat protein [Alphaproteobacteria bacterium]
MRTAGADGLFDLALGLVAEGRFDAAVLPLTRRAELLGRAPAALTDLGVMLARAGRGDEAVVALREALAAAPDFVPARAALGTVLMERGQVAEAEACLRFVLERTPDHPASLSNLGALLVADGRPALAESLLARAVALEPGNARSLNNLALCRDALGRSEEAMALLRRAMAAEPGYGDPACNLGRMLRLRGRFAEATAAYRQALAADPDNTEVHDNLLFCLCYDPTLSPEEVFAEHRRWGIRHAASVEAPAPHGMEPPAPHGMEPPAPHGMEPPAPHGNDRDPGRRLRIGYVSPDFREHSVACFIEPVLAAHDPRQVETVCYADVPVPDAVTVRLRGLAHHWRDLRGMSNRQVAALVREDGIDILVDLAGHTADNRLPVFAQRPAPLQVTWIGYPGTTGCPAIDVRFTDALADPPGAADALHTERLVRLPHGFLCYRPPDDAPEPAAGPPAEAAPTFGCFNNLAKVNDGVVAVWAALLAQVPGARLVLKSAQLADVGQCAETRTRFAEHGVDPDRLDLVGRVASRRDHFLAYGRVDVALDPFPYAGVTTTCESLWMGVPVVTLAGRTHAARVGVSLLTRVGLADLIAADEDHYVAIAAALVRDRTRLRSLRPGLRSRLAASPLGDAGLFTRALEGVYREMWRAWCPGGGA